MKETIKNLCVLLVVGYILYKLYEKFFGQTDLLNMDQFEDTVDVDLEAAAEESLADKVRSAAGRVFR